jgi:deazaflavin-dependent oxidoreductase (nitroreductase family)
MLADIRTACQDGVMGDDALSSEREFNEQNIEEFRRNGGKVGGQFEGFPLLLLTSTGARSGAQRVNPVAYFDIDDKIYVVGSAAGRENNPAWVHNIRANPRVSVEIGSQAPKAATARELPRGKGIRPIRSWSNVLLDSGNTSNAPIGSSRSSN